ncbi:MAG: hypothetical protein HUJ51_04855 [Eggerthellaceae bacterium]|nr:hypothetical protein [Eggerthellaceae bacterium]
MRIIEIMLVFVDAGGSRVEYVLQLSCVEINKIFLGAKVTIAQLENFVLARMTGF